MKIWSSSTHRHADESREEKFYAPEKRFWSFTAIDSILQNNWSGRGQQKHKMVRDSLSGIIQVTFYRYFFCRGECCNSFFLWSSWNVLWTAKLPLTFTEHEGELWLNFHFWVNFKAQSHRDSSPHRRGRGKNALEVHALARRVWWDCGEPGNRWWSVLLKSW